MERTLTPDERIRRAEEVYYRKRIQANHRDTARVSVGEKRNISSLKRMFLQIAICIMIYCILYLIQTTNYVFSGDIINKTKEILSHDINFESMYSQTIEYINSFTDSLNENNSPENANPTDENNLEDSQEDGIENTEENGAENTEGVGGTEVEEENILGNLNQMELDAKIISENYSIILPLKGTITSRFGTRNPTTETVPKYHTGIDIAVNEGTVFIAAMEGTVELVSSEGDYRKSYKNNKWRCYDFICTL